MYRIHRETRAREELRTRGGEIRPDIIKKDVRT